MLDLGVAHLTIHDITHMLREWAKQPELGRHARDPKSIHCSELYKQKQEIYCTVVGLKNAESPLGQKLASYLSMFGKPIIRVQ